MSRNQKTIPTVCTEKNISKNPTFLDIIRKQEGFWNPGRNHAADFINPNLSPNGSYVTGVAIVSEDLKSSPKNKLAVIRLDNGELETFGSREGSDSYPKWSPTGHAIAFISAVDEGSQLHLLDWNTKDARVVTNVPGAVENLQWASNGSKILLNVAGTGAEQGVINGRNDARGTGGAGEESWMPEIESPTLATQYRTVWVYDCATEHARQVSPPEVNFWEAVWSSNNSIVGICSDLPGEEYWYTANLRQINIEHNTVDALHTPSSPNSVEEIRASPHGSQKAFIIGVASDRKILWGDLHVSDAPMKVTTKINTLDVDVGCLEWCSEHDIIAAGARGLEEVVIHHNTLTGITKELWKSEVETIGPLFKPEISVYGGPELECVFVRSGTFSAPALVHVSTKAVRVIKKFGLSDMEEKMLQLATHEKIEWKAPDGLLIQGHFLAPRLPGPHPTILIVHGGPIFHHRARYIGELGEDIPDWLLLEAGFAVFKPNHRGSTGRGQSFIRHVYQDMAGADTHDFLSGLDFLVDSGRADPKRLGVCGVSYGGFMTCWLMTQTDRFVAAVPVALVSDWVSEHYTSLLGEWIRTFLGAEPHDPKGKYFTRSPLHHVTKSTASTPTLLVCGARDNFTPPGQALEFHRALVENGGTSVVLTYPEEGHGIRGMPACFDFAARAVEWFKHYV